MKSSLYDRSFFETIDSGSATSAAVVLGILAGPLKVKSYIDIGCGSGSWLRTAANIFEIPEEATVGIDGEYARSFHKNSKGTFFYRDLGLALTPSEIGRFDLVSCLEVAEHLTCSRADGLVSELCQLAPVVLFSAAIPGQGGTGHINEQWPDYWREKFYSRGFEMFDAIRPHVWTDNRVSPWYAQNCFLFIDRKFTEIAAEFSSATMTSHDWRLRIVHPGIMQLAACESAGFRRLFRALPSRFVAGLRSRIFVR